MQKGTFMRWFSAWFLVWLLAAVIILCLGFGIRVTAAAEAPANTPATDPRFAMIAALGAAGPHPSLGEHARVLGRLIGTWDVEYMDIAKNGKEIHRSGELLIGWVLDGRAIQDVWIVYPSESGKEREVYADVRYFDPKSQTWPAVFIDPQDASLATFTGGAVGEAGSYLRARTWSPGKPDDGHSSTCAATPWCFATTRRAMAARPGP
jgi:hypothetical protein